MTALNAAAHDLGRARWVSGRKLRSSLPRSNSLVENAEVIESLTPIYLTRQGTEPGESKTLGTTASHLLSTLHARRKKVFSVRDAASITRLQPDSARSFMSQLVQRGIASRLKPGLFVIVPQELADGSQFLGNPYVVGREFADAGDYFISHASAMDLHRMVTQPPLVVYVTTTRSIRKRTVLGTEYRFPRIKSQHLFGITDVWVDKTEQVRVSDIERTIVDGLRQTEYCGGISEVAKGFWMRRGDVQPQKLIDYALRLDIGAVIRRLGFLLEVLQVRVGGDIERLRERLTATYDLFDPTLPPEGRHLSRWKLRLNVSPEEIETVRST